MGGGVFFMDISALQEFSSVTFLMAPTPREGFSGPAVPYHKKMRYMIGDIGDRKTVGDRKVKKVS